MVDFRHCFIIVKGMHQFWASVNNGVDGKGVGEVDGSKS